MKPEHTGAASSSDSGKKPAGTKQATDIVFLKESLERAESNRRSKNYNLSVEGYQNLAEYFDQLGSTSSSRYFYQRCIAVAQEAGQSDAIAKANLNLGMYYLTYFGGARQLRVDSFGSLRRL